MLALRKEDVERAVQLIVNQVSIYRASKDFDIPEATLSRHRNQFLESSLEICCYKKNNNVKQVFTVGEDKLPVYCVFRAVNYTLQERKTQPFFYLTTMRAIYSYNLSIIPTIQLAKYNRNTMVTFHPHTSHKMQPLDRGIWSI